MKLKILAVLLLTGLLLSLCACGGETVSSVSAQTETVVSEAVSEAVPETAAEPVVEEASTSAAEEAPLEESAVEMSVAEDIASAALTPETVAGTYTFEESAMNGAFTVNWSLELRADSTYTITEENPFMGTLTYEGSYTIADDVIVCGAFEGEPPIAEFFAEDKTSRWLLDGETCTPESLASGDAAASGSEADFADVAYGTLSDSQVMDIHLPEGEGPFPVIVLVHGGGFMFGDQNMAVIQPVIAEGIAQGYAVASVDYRKSGEAVFPGALSDVKAAVRFLKANAEEYGIDPEKMILWGESAGAYLSLMTALTPDVAELNGDMTENLTESSAVPVLVDLYGPVEFYVMDDEASALGMDVSFGAEDSFESKFLGQALTKDQEKTYTTYWETYKNQLPADFQLKAWIQVGDADARVPYTQSETFASRLGETIGEENVEFSILSGADHEDDQFYTAENLQKIFAFLEEALG